MKGLLFLAWILLASSTLAIADNPPESNIFQIQPILVDAENRSIGTFTGPTVTHNKSGYEVKAFGMMSPKGYLAALLPSGETGGARSIYFEAKNCKGQPHILSENNSTVVESYLPGFVFTFGDPLKTYLIPKDETARQLALNSKLSATAKAFECINSAIDSNAYPLVPNDVNETGIPDAGFYGISVKVKSIRDEMLSRRKKHPFATPLEGRTREPLNFDQQGDTCSPGCDNDMISNGYCEPECNNRACGYDANDCTALEIESAIKKEEAQCAPLCEVGDLGDGFCDRACNNNACEFDKGDCPIN